MLKVINFFQTIRDWMIELIRSPFCRSYYSVLTIIAFTSYLEQDHWLSNVLATRSKFYVSIESFFVSTSASLTASLSKEFALSNASLILIMLQSLLIWQVISKFFLEVFSVFLAKKSYLCKINFVPLRSTQCVF